MADKNWPIVPGDFEVGDTDSAVAVLIIGRGIVSLRGSKISIKGTIKTENMGLEKVVTNVVSNPRIRFLIVCGKEEFGHRPGDAVLCLSKNGVDGQMRIIGSRSAIPFLCNLPLAAIERFREQVEVIDLVHPKEPQESMTYDPAYEFDPERAGELEATIESCLARDPGPFPGEPLVIMRNELLVEGPLLANQLNKLADDFVGQMLRMPSERLSIDATITIVSNHFRIILDPVDGEVRTVPSIEFAGRLQRYLRGGQ